MAKRSLIERLDEAVEAIMTNRDAPPARADRSLAALLRIAAGLRDLPSASFKARLKAELIKPARATRSAIASSPARMPAELPTATPYLMIKGAADAIEFYKRAFGATELMRMLDASGHIAHAEIKIADAPIMIADEAPEYGNLSPQMLGGSSAMVHIYVDNVDAVTSRAAAAGATVLEPVSDLFYGDRRGKLADPFGHVWMIATHKLDVSPARMRELWAKELARSAAQEKAAPAAKPLPEGFHTITPYLQVQGAARLIEFLKQAFGAEEILRVTSDDGKIGHSQVRIEGSMVELADASDRYQPNPTALWLFVGDADAVYKRALKAGAISMGEPVDQDYGDREASVKDPFGNHWYIATHRPDASPLPRELRSVTPYLHPMRSAEVIDFMKSAFDAEEVFRAQDAAGTVHHAKIRIGDSIIAMGDAHGRYQPMPPALHLYVSDTDQVYKRALEAGAISISEPADQPYGDRSAGVTDPFGNVWYIATPIEKRQRIKRRTRPKKR